MYFSGRISSKLWGGLFDLSLDVTANVCFYLVVRDVNSVFFIHSSAYDAKSDLKIAVKKLSRPFQSIIHAKRTYRELRLLKHMKHENVRGIALPARLPPTPSFLTFIHNVNASLNSFKLSRVLVFPVLNFQGNLDHFTDENLTTLKYIKLGFGW